MFFNNFKYFFILCFCLASDVCPQTCGLPSITPRSTKIINGDTAVPNSWPWLVSLRFGTASKSSHFCGGSLIDATTVITAADCVDGKNSFFVAVGTNYLNENITANAFAVKNIVKHSKYNSKTLDNDIAIIKLKNAVTFSKKYSQYVYQLLLSQQLFIIK